MPDGSVNKRPATCHPDKPHLARGLCAACYRRDWVARNPEQAKRTRKEGPKATCHPALPHVARGLCATCYRREVRAKDPDAARKYNRDAQRAAYPRRRRAIMLARYGLTPAEYDRMLAKQGGRCAACGTESDRLQVDHCHESGKVRGILCPNCNSALGHAQDDIDRLQRLISYLRLHQLPSGSDGAEEPEA